MFCGSMCMGVVAAHQVCYVILVVWAVKYWIYVAVVNRLKCFLPEMSAANAKLDQQIQQSPEAYDIENVSDSDERVIEMVSSIHLLYNYKCLISSATSWSHAYIW